MTQTTGAMSMRDCTVYYSTDSSDWVDISGVANQVNPKGYERESGEAWTGFTDNPVISPGKHSPFELEMTVVYTESSAEAFAILRAIKEAATPVRIQWIPKTGASVLTWQTGTGYLTAAPAPGGDLGDGKPILATIAGKFSNVRALGG